MENISQDLPVQKTPNITKGQMQWSSQPREKKKWKNFWLPGFGSVGKANVLLVMVDLNGFPQRCWGPYGVIFHIDNNDIPTR